MKKENKEFLKYSIRAQLVILKLLSLLIVGLTFLVAYMALNSYADRSSLAFSVFLILIVILAIACAFFVLAIRRVYKYLRKLKNLKL